MPSDADKELEQLRQENRALNEQVKQLVRTERRLSLSQQALDREVHRVEVLNGFSLASRRDEKPQQILCHALEMLFELFPFERGIGFFRMDGHYVSVARKITPGLSCRISEVSDRIPMEAVQVQDVPPAVAFESAAELNRKHSGLGPFLRIFLSCGDELPEYPILACPIFIHGGKRFEGIMLLRRVSTRLSFLEHLPGPEDVPFLRLVGAHVAQAIENVILYSEAQQAVQVRDEFLSVASHELRTPITPLKNELQLIHLLARRDTLASYPKDRLLKLVEIADRELIRLTRLIDGMLEVTRMTSGRFTLKPEDVALDALIADMALRFQPAAMEAGSRLDLDLQSGEHGNWDRVRLEQVISNLITNAIRYGARKPITLRSRSTGDAVAISVQDLGIGISAESQARLFRKFETVGTDQEFGGLGLGLYITRQIVEAHGGTIHVSSSPGQGSTFTVELPLPRGTAKTA